MRIILYFTFLLIGVNASAQAVIGGGGVCAVSGNPNSVSDISDQDFRSACLIAYDTIAKSLYWYDKTKSAGQRWVKLPPSGIRSVYFESTGTDLPLDSTNLYKNQASVISIYLRLQSGASSNLLVNMDNPATADLGKVFIITADDEDGTYAVQIGGLIRVAGSIVTTYDMVHGETAMLYAQETDDGNRWVMSSVSQSKVASMIVDSLSGFTTIVDSTRVLSDSIAVYYQNGVEVGRDTIRVPSSGGSGTVTSIAAGNGISVSPSPITTTGTVSADTSVLASKTFLSGQLILKLNISDTAAMLAPYLLGSELLPTWTTAGRPAAPSAGRTGYNTTAGNLDFYGASAWENPLRSATATGLGTANQIFLADANGRAASLPELTFASNKLTLKPNATYPLNIQHSTVSDYRWYFQTQSASSGQNQIASMGFATTDGGAPSIQFRGDFNLITINSGLVVTRPGVATGAIVVYGATASASTTGNGAEIYDITGFTGGYKTHTSGTYNSFVPAGLGFQISSGSGVYNHVAMSPLINQTGTATGITRTMLINPNISAAVDHRALEIANNSQKAIYQSGASATNNLAGNTHIGATTTPARTLHVTGEARITDLTTDTPTQIVGADADGDLGAITVGSGLSLSAGTLTATGGVSDGDKGDIDVTSSGAVWTIDTASVTTVKISDGSVTQDKLASGAAGGAKLGGLTYISADDTDVNLSSYLSIDWLTNYSQLVVWLRIGNTASRTVTFPTPSSTYQGKVVEIFFGATNHGTHFGQITSGGTNRITVREVGTNVTTYTTYDAGQTATYMKVICAQDPNTLAYQWLVLDVTN